MTRILTAYSWEHENPAGDTWIAGWGIWNNEHDEPIIYDGFATEQLALAGIDILPPTCWGRALCGTTSWPSGRTIGSCGPSVTHGRRPHAPKTASSARGS
jgi:hypothetical protein